MKKLLATLAIVGFTAPALAQAVDFDAVDTDGSGSVSWEEAQVAWPELTEDEFNAADLDGSGELSPEEFESLAHSAAPGMDDYDNGDDAEGEAAPIQ